MGVLVLGDTAIASLLIYFAEQAASDLYLTYFLLVLIAASTPTLKMHMGLSLVLSAAYGAIQYLGLGPAGLLHEGHLLRVPVLLIMATFYGLCADAVRKERREKVGLLETITALRRTEEALAAEKERLAVTLRSIGDGVITTDTNGAVVLMNKVAEALTGWTHAEALGRPLTEVFHIIHEKTRQRCENPVEKVLSSGGIVGLANNTALLSKDGTERIIADSGAPIRMEDGTTLGVVLVFRDVTERLKMEQDLLTARKLESIGILAGGIAHDFNNILTAVIGNLSLAKLSVSPAEELYQRLTEAEKASLRAQSLTQQLLTFARGGEPVKRTTSIVDVLKESASFVLRGSNVRCDFVLPGDLWPVAIDEGQMSQVIHNLVLNAQQAMPGGGVIAERAGVGAHDGYLTVESELGRGTTFSMYLAASPLAALSAKGKDAGPRAGRGRILVMDDEEPILNMLGQMLARLGYEAGFARDGAEAIAVYRQARDAGRPYDAVIMDLTIPGGMGGKEAIQRLRELDPQVIAIVSSGYATDPIMAHFRDYGFRGVIAKPYKIQDLSDVVHRVMHGTD